MDHPDCDRRRPRKALLECPDQFPRWKLGLGYSARGSRTVARQTKLHGNEMAGQYWPAIYKLPEQISNLGERDVTPVSTTSEGIHQNPCAGTRTNILPATCCRPVTGQPTDRRSAGHSVPECQRRLEHALTERQYPESNSSGRPG